jgi:histidinol dehydrogenase
VIRILRLNQRVAASFLKLRRRRDIGAERVAARIIADVRRNGDAALLRWTRRLDAISLTPKTLWVSPREIMQARRLADRRLIAAIEHAARNIRRVAERQRPRPWSLKVEWGVEVRQRVEPLEVVGCYVPGGRFSLVSTLLMTAIPAQVAGVRRIVVACSRPGPGLLAVAGILGLKEIARVGGAQAVAALAYGTGSFPRADKIFGPGNRYVTAAKQLVSSDCAIDLPAGPTEVLVVAQRGNPRFIAADLLAQAEHDNDAVALFVTTSHRLALAVRDELSAQLRALPKTNPAWRSLERNGGILLARTLRDAVGFANEFAPEHLSLPGNEESLLRGIHSAGSIFLGPWSAQPVGDYASGSNHVLPTSGWGHSRGGLSTADFVKCLTVQRISRDGLRRLAPVVSAFAEAENLMAHARAVEVRQ